MEGERWRRGRKEVRDGVRREGMVASVLHVIRGEGEGWMDIRHGICIHYSTPR